MNEQNRNRRIRKLLLSGTALLLAAPAMAQQASVPSIGLEEVVVTAEKRSASLQKTPIAITAFSGEALAEKGIQNILELNTRLPNVFIGGASGGGTNAASFFIRGIGVDRNSLQIEPGVGLYIDDIYYSKTAGAFLSILDVASLEVLRGPQGTLFGKNTIGGAIRYVTVKPNQTFSASAEVNVGEYNRKDFKGSVNLPVNDALAAKLSVGSYNIDGYVHSIPNDSELGGDHTNVVRAQVRFTPSSKWTFDLSFDATRSFNNGSPQYLFNVNSTLLRATQWNALHPNQPYDARYVTGDPFRSNVGYTGFRLNGYGLTAVATYDMADNLSLKSLTGYRRTAVKYKLDWDGSPLEFNQPEVNQTLPSFSQEFQAVGDVMGGRLKWIAGLYYFYEHPEQLDDRHTFWEPFGSTQLDQTQSASQAAFLQLNYSVTDDFKVTVGGRYSRDRKSVYAYKPLNPAPINRALQGANSKTANDFSPRFVAQYQLTPDVMTYASYAKGYRTGGFNTGVTNTAPNDGVLPFNNEKAYSMEAGIKAEFFDHRLRTNLAVFQTKYKEMQVAASQNGAFLLVANVGRSTIKGYEAEVEWRATSGLTLGANIGQMDSKYNKLGSAQQSVSSITLDSRLAGAPDLSYSIFGNYRHELQDGSSAVLNVEYGWKDKVQSYAADATAVLLPSYGLLNASLFYNLPGGRYSVGVTGKNILDKFYLLTGNRFDTVAGGNAGPGFWAVGRPSEVYVTAKAKF